MAWGAVYIRLISELSITWCIVIHYYQKNPLYILPHTEIVLRELVMSTGSTPSSLFTSEHWQQIEQVLRTLNEQQAQWLGNHLGSESKNAPASSAARIAIVHGGETGNGEGIARKLSDRLQLAG